MALAAFVLAFSRAAFPSAAHFSPPSPIRFTKSRALGASTLRTPSRAPATGARASNAPDMLSSCVSALILHSILRLIYGTQFECPWDGGLFGGCDCASQYLLCSAISHFRDWLGIPPAAECGGGGTHLADALAGP